MIPTVRIRAEASVTCGACKRELTQAEEFSNASDMGTLREISEGDTAVLTKLRKRVVDVADRRGWRETEDGLRCAHCLAAKMDPRTDPDPATDNDCS